MNEVYISEKLSEIGLIADEINDKAFLLQHLLGFISGCADLQGRDIKVTIDAESLLVTFMSLSNMVKEIGDKAESISLALYHCK